MGANIVNKSNKSLLEIPRRSAQPADPVDYLRQNPIRHLTFETPFSRFYRVPNPWDPGLGGNPWGPMGWVPPGGPRPWGGRGPWGPLGVIPKPFRMESHFDWMVIPNGKPFRLDSPNDPFNNTLRTFWLQTTLLTIPYEHFGSRTTLLTIPYEHFGSKRSF